MDQQFTRRIVLLGKSGTGKSRLCNTLFGEEVFKESASANSVTHLCQSFTKTINGKKIQLVDTPGLFDTDESNEQLKSELLKSIIECAPGPHAFLLLFKIDRFSPQEQEIVNTIENDYFGDEALKYTTLVFTHGDQLPEGVKIEEWVKENKSLKSLLEKCQNRCCVIDNKYWNNNQNNQDPYRNNQNQIKKLLQIIDQTVRENKGKHYSNEMLQMVQKQIEEKKAQLRQSSPKMSEEERSNVARAFVHNNLKKVMIAVGIGVLVGALLGGVAGFAVAKYYAASCGVKCLAAGVGAVAGGAVGGAVGHRLGSNH